MNDEYEDDVSMQWEFTLGQHAHSGAYYLRYELGEVDCLEWTQSVDEDLPGLIRRACHALTEELQVDAD